MNARFRPNIHVSPNVTARCVHCAVDRFFKRPVQSVLTDHCLNFEAKRRESELKTNASVFRNQAVVVEHSLSAIDPLTRVYFYF